MADSRPKHKPNEKHTLDEVLKSLQDLVRNDVLDKSVEPESATAATAPPSLEPPAKGARMPPPRDMSHIIDALEDLLSTHLDDETKPTELTTEPEATTKTESTTEIELSPVDERAHTDSAETETVVEEFLMSDADIFATEVMFEVNLETPPDTPPIESRIILSNDMTDEDIARALKAIELEMAAEEKQNEERRRPTETSIEFDAPTPRSELPTEETASLLELESETIELTPRELEIVLDATPVEEISLESPVVETPAVPEPEILAVLPAPDVAPIAVAEFASPPQAADNEDIHRPSMTKDDVDDIYDELSDESTLSSMEFEIEETRTFDEPSDAYDFQVTESQAPLLAEPIAPAPPIVSAPPPPRVELAPPPPLELKMVEPPREETQHELRLDQPMAAPADDHAAEDGGAVEAELAPVAQQHHEPEIPIETYSSDDTLIEGFEELVDLSTPDETTKQDIRELEALADDLTQELAADAPSILAPETVEAAPPIEPEPEAVETTNDAPVEALTLDAAPAPSEPDVIETAPPVEEIVQSEPIEAEVIVEEIPAADAPEEEAITLEAPSIPETLPVENEPAPEAVERMTDDSADSLSEELAPPPVAESDDLIGDRAEPPMDMSFDTKGLTLGESIEIDLSTSESGDNYVTLEPDPNTSPMELAPPPSTDSDDLISDRAEPPMDMDIDTKGLTLGESIEFDMYASDSNNTGDAPAATGSTLEMESVSFELEPPVEKFAPKPEAKIEAPKAAPAEPVAPKPATRIEPRKEIPVLKDVAVPPPADFKLEPSPLPKPAAPPVPSLHHTAVQIIAKLNIELRKSGEKPLSAKNVNRLQQLLKESLTTDKEKK